MDIAIHYVLAERSLKLARKRANGEGKLRQRKDGTWECTLMDGYKPDGRPNMKSFYGKTQAAVKKKKLEYLLEFYVLPRSLGLQKQLHGVWRKNFRRGGRSEVSDYGKLVVG